MDLKGNGMDGLGVDSYGSGLGKATIYFENNNEDLGPVKRG